MTASRPPGRGATRVDPAAGPGARDRLDAHRRVVVAGGGLAGIAAAVALAERGVAVTVVEAEDVLGGRLSAHDDRLATGDEVQSGRGFHAVFRQYYNLRALLRRVDPELMCLRPLEDYPMLGPGGAVERFAGLPRRPPLNLLALVARTPTMRWRDLRDLDPDAARAMFEFDPRTTYAELDHIDAATYLDSLGFPPEARRMLFEVFARSFFNRPAQLSAAELLAMFHLYFLGTHEGVVFDVFDEPFSDVVWRPLARYLASHGADVRTGEAVEGVERRNDGWEVATTAGVLGADAVVLALPVRPLQAVVAASPDLGDDGWRARVAALASAPPFGVWRLWLDRPLAPGRPPFLGTTGLGLVDNVSAPHLFEGESRRWALRQGGSVVEVHAYALSPEARSPGELRARLAAELHAVWPETADAGILDERLRIDADCPAFAPGSWADRPGVTTPSPGVVMAGDHVRVAFPCALMERAVSTGLLAAGELLALWGVRPAPVWSVPALGWVAALKTRVGLRPRSRPGPRPGRD